MRLAAAAAVACAHFAAAPPNAHAGPLLVDPHDTDPRLTSERGNASNHVWSADRPTGRLVVFLGGSGSKPGFYEVFGARAARRGADVIDLRYPNRAVRSICPGSLPAAAADACFVQARGNTIFGTGSAYGTLPGEPTWLDRSGVSVAESVVGRLVRLLTHLDWRQYLIDGDTPYGRGVPDWSRIVVAGHSQGAGHALFLARRLRVASAVLLSGPGDTAAGLPPSWLDAASVTPPADISALRAAGEGELCGGCAANWARAGVTRTTTTTVRPRSCLGAPCPAATEHNGTAVDSALALDADGAPVLGPVWDSMLEVRTSEVPALPPALGRITALRRVRGGFRGRIRSSERACAQRRRLVLRRRDGGVHPYARGITDASGGFTLKARVRGSVYVVAPATARCARAATRPRRFA